MTLTNIEAFQRTVARALIALCLVHVPLLALMAGLRGQGVVAVTSAALALALAAAALYRVNRSLKNVGRMIGITLVGQTSLAVFVMRGHPWQIEAHFYYFAVLALLLGFCCWRTLVFTAALILVHHLTLNALLPEALYPGGADIARALVHGAVVMVETAMLIVICMALRTTFQRADAARQTAEEVATALEQAAFLRESTLTETTARAERMRALLGRFEHEMAASIDTLYGAAEGLRGSADDLGASAARTSAQVITVSTAADDTARKVDLAAQGGEELAATINQIGTSAAQSSNLAAAVVKEAQSTNDTIHEMAAVAAEIGKVTDLISGIAEQTNLLALNATIEAARAGEAGRGFAVVAQEVKALASQTATATHEIATRIAAMQSTTGRSVAAIEAISARIHELDSVAASIAESVRNQALATGDIAANVASAATGVGHVGKAIFQIEGLVGTNSDAVLKMSEIASRIVGQTKTIRQRVRLFTDDIESLRA